MPVERHSSSSSIMNQIELLELARIGAGTALEKTAGDAARELGKAIRDQPLGNYEVAIMALPSLARLVCRAPPLSHFANVPGWSPGLSVAIIHDENEHGIIDIFKSADQGAAETAAIIVKIRDECPQDPEVVAAMRVLHARGLGPAPPDSGDAAASSVTPRTANLLAEIQTIPSIVFLNLFNANDTYVKLMTQLRAEQDKATTQRRPMPDDDDDDDDVIEPAKKKKSWATGVTLKFSLPADFDKPPFDSPSPTNGGSRPKSTLTFSLPTDSDKPPPPLERPPFDSPSPPPPVPPQPVPPPPTSGGSRPKPTLSHVAASVAERLNERLAKISTEELRVLLTCGVALPNDDSVQWIHNYNSIRLPSTVNQTDMPGADARMPMLACMFAIGDGDTAAAPAGDTAAESTTAAKRAPTKTQYIIPTIFAAIALDSTGHHIIEQLKIIEYAKKQGKLLCLKPVVTRRYLRVYRDEYWPTAGNQLFVPDRNNSVSSTAVTAETIRAYRQQRVAP